MVQVSTAALALFQFGQEEAAKRGLLLVDTKYEFGKDASGTIRLVDEIHTPDSSRCAHVCTAVHLSDPYAKRTCRLSPLSGGQMINNGPTIYHMLRVLEEQFQMCFAACWYCAAPWLLASCGYGLASPR